MGLESSDDRERVWWSVAPRESRLRGILEAVGIIRHRHVPSESYSTTVEAISSIADPALREALARQVLDMDDRHATVTAILPDGSIKQRRVPRKPLPRV